MKRQAGFTLIELMVVIAIIGILASIGIPHYYQYSKRAKFAEVVASITPIKTGIEICLQKTQSTGDCDDWDKIGVTQSSAMNGPNVFSAVITEAASTITVSMTGDSTTVNGAVYAIDGLYDNAANTMVWNLNAGISTCDDADKKYC